MSKHMPPYPPEFRAEAIRLARTSGKPHAEIARELGMTGETLRLWLKQADLDEGKRSDGLTRDELCPGADPDRGQRRSHPQDAAAAGHWLETGQAMDYPPRSGLSFKREEASGRARRDRGRGAASDEGRAQPDFLSTGWRAAGGERRPGGRPGERPQG